MSSTPLGKQIEITLFGFDSIVILLFVQYHDIIYIAS